MKTIICSHGFGVKADSRGMFPDIQAGLPDYKLVTFDYNRILPGGDTVVASLEEQAKTLQSVIDSHGEENNILLAHSQGCIVAGLVDLSKVSQVILLAPPVIMSMERVIQKLIGKPGGEHNPEGTSKLPRSDGTITYLPKEYLQSVRNKNPMKIYQQIVDTKPTTIVRATKDEIIGLTKVNEIENATHIDIAADHNFTGENRSKLIKALREQLQ